MFGHVNGKRVHPTRSPADDIIHSEPILIGPHDEEIGRLYQEKTRQAKQRLLVLFSTAITMMLPINLLVGLITNSPFNESSETEIEGETKPFFLQLIVDGHHSIQNAFDGNSILSTFIGLLATIAALNVSVSLTDMRSFRHHSLDTQIDVSRWKESITLFMRVSALGVAVMLLVSASAFRWRSPDYWFKTVVASLAAICIIWLANIASTRQLSVETSIRRFQVRNELLASKRYIDNLDGEIVERKNAAMAKPAWWKLPLLILVISFELLILWLMAAPEQSMKQWMSILAIVLVPQILSFIFVLVMLKLSLTQIKIGDRIFYYVLSAAFSISIIGTSLTGLSSAISKIDSLATGPIVLSLTSAVMLFLLPFLMHCGERMHLPIIRSIYRPTRGGTAAALHRNIQELERRLCDLENSRGRAPERLDGGDFTSVLSVG